MKHYSISSSIMTSNGMLGLISANNVKLFVPIFRPTTEVFIVQLKPPTPIRNILIRIFSRIDNFRKATLLYLCQILVHILLSLQKVILSNPDFRVKSHHVPYVYADCRAHQGEISLNVNKLLSQLEMLSTRCLLSMVSVGYSRS